ncbi:MAG: Fic/DOC family protein [Methyloligellaceae bacterium]
MYEAVDDPYCYPGTGTLINELDIREPGILAEFEVRVTAVRAEEPLPGGRLSATQYRKVHHHLFQDVYSWAGRYRSTRISKGGSMFCYPENIANEMAKLFADLKRRRFFRKLSRHDFATQAAHFLADLNAIHPFRDGNGRTQLAFMTLLADRAGHPFDLDALDTDAVIPAMEASFNGDEKPLVKVLLTMCEAGDTESGP